MRQSQEIPPLTILRTRALPPLSSKEELVFSVGPRLFRAAPLFSQGGPGNKHKFERFLLPGDFMVASIYAPIFFPPAPVLVFK